jgi:hypothetical protein
MQARTQQQQAPAADFLRLLGKDPAQTWFRTIRPGKGANASRRGADLHGLDLEALHRDNANGEAVYFVTGDSTAASGKGGGVLNRDITACRMVFAEWDNRPIEWQLQAWQEQGLPEPTVMVLTGGKSVHCYWLLTEALPPAQWQALQIRLIQHCGSDPACKNPARLMRLPGFAYIDKTTGKATGAVAEVVHASGKTYTAAEIEACLPSLLQPVAPAPAPAPANSSKPRTLQEIEAAAAFTPQRVVGGNTYETCRRALCGCAAALAEIGLPEERALDLLASKWPDRATAQQALQSSTTREAASFWAIASEHGYDLSRKAKVVPLRVATQAPPQQQQPPKPGPEGIETCLRERIAEGISEANLATLITWLADESGIQASAIKQIADKLKDEHRRSLAVQQEALALAAEADRKELGQALTAAYLLPPAVAAAINTRTRYLPCDGPSAVLPFLSAVAGLVKLGTQVEASAVAGYRVPINLFACLVGKSGAMKSPSGRLLVEAPTQQLQADLARANQQAFMEWEETCKGMKKGEQRPAKPRPKRLKVSDFTGEALADQLQTQEAHGLGLLIHRDELSGLFGMLNAYRSGKGADEQQLLELFDGGGLNSLRIVGDRHYNRSQVSIYGGTPTDVLRQLVAEGDASGLWARFLFVPLPERAVRLPLSTNPAEVAEVEEAAETLARTCKAIYAMPPQTYRLSPTAAEKFAHYHYSRQQAALAAATGAQSALYGKSAGKVLRVAGTLHLLQIAAGETDGQAQIEPATIDRATALVDHLDAWALGLHSEVAAGGVGQLMRTVHTTAEALAAPIRWKEVQTRLSKAQRKDIDSAAVAEAMQALAAAGYGEIEPGKRGGFSYRATRSLP